MLLRRCPLLVASVLFAVVACKAKTTGPAPLPTASVIRGDIAVRVQATGSVEPIDPVDIKSKAQGTILRLPVEVGSRVEKGALIAQIDPRDVKNQFDQAMADDVVAAAALNQALRDQARKDTLFLRHVITVAEHDSARSSIAAVRSDMVTKRANLDLARQKTEDATMEAPIGGTVISRPVTQGQIITSATSASGGTTLMTIADLNRVRMRVTIDEVEMGNVRIGQPATVQVDAFPDHPFQGVIEKVEPQAVVTQGVTFFPVLVSISNKDGLLMPGMNGEVTIKAADLTGVLQVPIDAVRPTNELAPVARMFAIAVDTLVGLLRRDLVGGEGTTGVPGRYVVVALPTGGYEMRLVKTGPTDLRVMQIIDGVKEGDKVVALGAIMTSRPAVPPKLQIAADMRRAAPAARASDANGTTTQAGTPTRPVTPAQPGASAQPGTSARVGKPLKP
jgi:HlyD family secretion protein